MDNTKAKIALDKINVLFKNVNLNPNHVSALEKDLLLSYVREFYEALLKDTSTTTQPTTSNIPEKPDFEIVTPSKPITPPAAKPKFIEIEEEEPVVQSTPIINREPVEQPARTPIETKNTFVQEPIKPSGPKAAFEQLFEYKKATELSEKLSESPISDLTRAMSINDKLLYVNELFDRDIEAFNETLKVLNRFDSLNDAKGLLSNLAERYDWLNGEKIDISRDFIKLVRRRYL